jgi:lysine 6-dehydrogenase
MKALLLGCGEMGEEALRDLYQYGSFNDIIVGTRTSKKAERVVKTLGGKRTRVSAVRVDACDEDALVALMKGANVVVNCVGPNYMYELPVARAAIRARVDLVDLNDEFEITCRMFELDEAAREAGITIVLGLGGCPGIDNVLVRAAANQLDEVWEVHTAWVMSGADPGGPALSQHLLYSLSGRALTYRDGKFLEVQSFQDGKERVEFPEPVGAVDVYHIGHPEPIALARSFPGATVIDDKATFVPPSVNEEILRLGKTVRDGTGVNRVEGRDLDVMESAALSLHRMCRNLQGVSPQAALRVNVKGRKKNKVKSIFFSSVGRLAPATGIPASIGALLLVDGKVNAKGVLPPEQCVDPNDFLYEILTRRNVAHLNGWVDEE